MSVSLTCRPRRALLVVGLLAALFAGCTNTPPDVSGEPSSTPSGRTQSPQSRQSPQDPQSSHSVPGSAGTAATDRISIAITGDVLLHERLWATARFDGHGAMDFAPALAPVKALVSGADLAICHLETPLAPAAGPYHGYPRFSAPPQVATALKQTGYDACSTASNHSFDGGAAGVTRTLDTLDAVGLRHAGTARTPAEAVTPVLIDVRGVEVALLSYTFGFNGLPYPGGDTWRANRLDESRIRAAAKTARAAGAQIVVLVCHWGTEYSHQPNTQQRTLAPRFAADPDIDLVVGHHAHVVQPLEKIGDTWVAYGLGNFVAAHAESSASNTEGLLVRFTFRRAADGSWHTSNAEYAALLDTAAVPVRVLDVRHELGTHGSGLASPDRLRQAQRSTEAIVNSRGAAEDGATPISSP